MTNCLSEFLQKLEPAKAAAVVLHVDDDPNDAFLLGRALKQIRPQVSLVHVDNGQQALDYLQAKGQYADRAAWPEPTLVLLDLNMPGLSGFEVLSWVRGQQALSNLPIVILTSSDADQDRARASKLGATRFLVKDYRFTDVSDRVSRLLCA
jgi:CheY-like chemotaxis protein